LLLGFAFWLTVSLMIEEEDNEIKSSFNSLLSRVKEKELIERLFSNLDETNR
jgi:hypothetical protein